MPFTTRGQHFKGCDYMKPRTWPTYEAEPRTSQVSPTHMRASSFSGWLTDLCKIRNRARKKLLPQLMYSTGKARPHWKIAVSILVWLNGACWAHGMLNTTQSATRMPQEHLDSWVNRRKAGQEALCLSAHFSWTATTMGCTSTAQGTNTCFPAQLGFFLLRSEKF